jgi:Tol biopolymer transport system component/imidazolonepropionase-like amidohydrolase
MRAATAVAPALAAALHLACGPAGPIASAGVQLQSTALHVDTVTFEVSEGTRLALDVSPDGRWIVFDLLGQLWRVPFEGGAATALGDAVRDVGEDVDPAVSPDGTQIVFQSDRAEGRTLFVMPAAGGPARKLVDRNARYFAYLGAAWSPDSRTVSYAVEDTLAVVDVVSGAERVLTIDSLPPVAPALPWLARNRSPAFSPDGDRIAFVNSGGDGRIWEVATSGGSARPLTSGRAIAPAYSPDGSRLAFLAQDNANRWQASVQDLATGDVRSLTSHEEVANVRVRWTPDGTALVYSGDGGIWRVLASGGDPLRIPFTARVKLPRTRAALRPVTFPQPGVIRTAVGFAEIELAPDGQKYAMVALDTLWIVPLDGVPRPLVSQPGLYGQMTWSPDGRQLAWIRAEGPDMANLFAVDVASGNVRRLTSDGASWIARWSPDGRWIATRGEGHLRLVPVTQQGPPSSAEIRDLGSLTLGWGTLAWSPASDALVVADLPVREDSRQRARAVWIPLDGERRTIARFPAAPAHLNLSPDGYATYAEDNLLWRVRWSGANGMQGTPLPLSDDPAIEPRYAADGSVLYIGADGLRLRRPDGGVRSVPWPLRYVTRSAPPPLLVRNAHVIDGRGAVSDGVRDLLIENGRISRIEGASALAAPAGANVVDAAGGYVMPGLIDLHAHIWDDRLLAAWLHNGVTTVRDISSQRLHTPDSRNRIEAGAMEGPRIVYAAGLFHGGLGFSTLTDQMVSDSAAVARGIAIMAGMGSQYIKERGFSGWTSAVHVAREANRFGLPASGHCSHILPVVAAGMHGREHIADCFRDWGVVREDFAKLAAASGQWVVTTAGMLSLSQLKALDDSTLIDAPDVGPFMPASARQWFASDSVAQRRRASLIAGLERRAHAMRTYRSAGATLAAGTDNIFPLGMQHELEALVLAGMAPMEAIVAGTSTAARVLNAPEIGVIETGRLADLIILDASPLEDITNLRRISHVVQGGRIVDRAALRRPVEY